MSIAGDRTNSLLDLFNGAINSLSAEPSTLEEYVRDYTEV
jgi:hypothetical protein